MFFFGRRTRILLVAGKEKSSSNIGELVQPANIGAEMVHWIVDGQTSPPSAINLYIFSDARLDCWGGYLD